MFRRLYFTVGLFAVYSIAQGKRIAQTKCEEYINGTKTTVSVIPLVYNPRPIVFHSFNCSKIVSLIVGGEEAKKGEFRHHALLGWETEWRSGEYSFDCGGTLISDRFVLTAAHCTSAGVGPRSAPKIVRFAERHLSEVGDEFDIEIDSFTRHPEYRFGTSYHDIALIRLAQRVRFSSLVRPACLWDDENTNLTSVVATGFGRMAFDNPYASDTLRKVKLDIQSPSVCNEHFAGTRNFKRGMTGKQLCIGSTLGGRDTCQGDSGGPVQVLLNPKGCIYHVVGITSAGLACGLGNTPAIYTKVASYLDWIEAVVWG